MGEFDAYPLAGPLPQELYRIQDELDKLLNLQRTIEAQIPERRAQSLAGKTERHEFESWKASAMRVKKRAVARYRELKELKKDINRREFSERPNENTLLLREIADTLLDIRDHLTRNEEQP